MGEIEDRQELMTIARAMITLGHELRAELKGFTQKGDLVINKLIETADRMLPAVMDERETQRGPKGKKEVVYKKGTGDIGDLIPPDVPHKLAPGKRACSACRKPGHRKGSPECEMTEAAYKRPRGKEKK